MKHFIYKTTHANGKYYIGRHSTDDINDGYLGSGRWVAGIKDRSKLSRVILEFAGEYEELVALEQKYIDEHFGKPNCMNLSQSSVTAVLSGENHWMNTNPEALKAFLERHPNKDGRNAKVAMKSGKHINLTNNSSIWRSEQGIHHWQNGKSPNANSKLNAKLISAGTHNFLGPDTNQKRIDDETHNFLGSAQNEKMLAEGTHPSKIKITCLCCCKTVSSSMYKRWHGDNCKQKSTPKSASL